MRSSVYSGRSSTGAKVRGVGAVAEYSMPGKCTPSRRATAMASRMVRGRRLRLSSCTKKLGASRMATFPASVLKKAAPDSARPQEYLGAAHRDAVSAMSRSSWRAAGCQVVHRWRGVIFGKRVMEVMFRLGSLLPSTTREGYNMRTSLSMPHGLSCSS